MHKIKLTLDYDSIDAAIKGIDQYKAWIDAKAHELGARLAEIGLQKAIIHVGHHIFTGDTFGSLHVENRGKGKFAVVAESEAILFLEFGTGVTNAGVQHPLAGELGLGPGTYPGEGHWDDPNGWWFKTDDPRLIKRVSLDTNQGYGHTYGQPARMPMYLTARDLERVVGDVVREVFR